MSTMVPVDFQCLLVFKDGKGWEKDRSGLRCWTRLGTQHHLLSFPISNSLRAHEAPIALSHCLTGKILAQNDWYTFPQKISLLWKEVCALRCFEEPAEVLVEVLDDKVGKLVERVEWLMENVFLELITGKEFPEIKESGQNIYDLRMRYTN